MIWQVVLAAGASRRMGQPKALLDIDGRSAVERIVSRGLDAGCRGSVVVVGSEALGERVRETVAHVRPLAGAESIRIEVNPRPEAGRTGSLQCGLSCLPPEVSGILVHPVDHPLVGIETLRCLVAAPGRDPSTEPRMAWVFEPCHGERRGHPFLVMRAAFASLTALGPDDPLHDWMRGARGAGHAFDLAVDDPAIHANLDTPEDVERWLGTGQG